MPPKLYLLDGHALAYRTYYALTRGSAQGWATRAGEPTAGVYGFASVLLRILEQERPDYLIVVFDTGKTFRDDLFPEYKATRAKMPEDLIPQIGRIRQLVDAFNIPRVEVDGYEADDALASLAKKAVAQGLGVKIITGDRDLLQLVDERIIVNLPGKTLAEAKDYLPSNVVGYLGVTPGQVVDYKALVGDKSDNIPGVMGVGEKTAISLLNQYSNLDTIYARLADLPLAVQKKLEAGRESAYLSRKLATLITNLDVPLDLEKARADHFDPRRVEELFRELEFRSLYGRLTELIKAYQAIPHPVRQLSLFDQAILEAAEPRRIAEKPSPAGPRTVEGEGISVQIVNTPQALEELKAVLANTEIIAFDTETTSTDQMSAELVGISLSIRPGQSFYLPLGHRASSEEQIPLPIALEALRPCLTNPRQAKIGHNCKYDFVVLARQGLRVAPLTFDTMIAEWLINPTSRNLGLKNLAWVRLGAKMSEIETLIGKGKNQRSMADVPIAEVAAYAGADAEATLRLKTSLQAELESAGANALFHDLEMPLVPVLADMEMSGIRLDSSFLAGMSVELETRLKAIEAQIFEKVGASFNLNSPPQLSEALFVRLGLKPPDKSKRTATGFYSTAADVLDSMSGMHPVVDMVLEYRELSKLKSTYVDALPAQVNARTGRVHTSYNQTGSVTGRIASQDPNLQNIPIRTELGRQVRRAFVAENGCRLLSVDYSQIELRIVAHMADDQAMLAAFQAGQDIHTATAAAIFGIPLGSVTKDQRRQAKSVNFGLIYGMSAFGLTRTTELTLAEAEDFVRTYFAQFPGVKRYLDGMRRKAADEGHVETLLGRHRYFPGLKNQTNQNLRGREEREAINAPIQGSAADIMKIAMLRVPEALKTAGLSGKMLLQVHDELVFECPKEETKETATIVQQVMQDAYPLKARLLTEARQGPNWYEMEVLEE